MQSVLPTMLTDHIRNPHHSYALTNYHVRYQSQNPLCGDELTIYLRGKNQTSIEEASFQGNCCTICLTSSSIMMKLITHKKMGEVKALIEHSASLRSDPLLPSEFTDLKNLWLSLQSFPVRHKCASFPWLTLNKALAQMASCEIP